jgi:NAD(P)H-dependent FMN reductase
MKDFEPVGIALIVGSTRPNRFADVPARWVERGAAGHPAMVLETLDLRDWPLPFLEEPTPPTVTGGVFSNPVAERCLAAARTAAAVIESIAE